MAESHQSQPHPSTPARSSPAAPESDPSSQYWCYHCDKRVLVETLGNLPDVVCSECKNGFVELIAAPAAAAAPSLSPSSASRTPSDFVDDPAFGSQFLQVLRLIAQTSRDDDAPPHPPPDHSSDDDFLRIELNGWHNDDDEDENHEEDEEDGDGNRESQMMDDEDEDVEEVDEEDIRRRRRDVLRLRIRDIAARAPSGRNRILDWAEILMGLEDNSIEFRVEMTDPDGYIGNPEDYVDAAGYEALLQNLAESDQSGRRGAPPASKLAISQLPTMTISSEDDLNKFAACAICKDGVSIGETVKQLPCGHDYHEDCIVPWLGSRNTCPVCRYELATDDPEYEEERKNKKCAGGASASG